MTHRLWNQPLCDQRGCLLHRLLKCLNKLGASSRALFYNQSRQSYRKSFVRAAALTTSRELNNRANLLQWRTYRLGKPCWLTSLFKAQRRAQVHRKNSNLNFPATSKLPEHNWVYFQNREICSRVQPLHLAKAKQPMWAVSLRNRYSRKCRCP